MSPPVLYYPEGTTGALEIFSHFRNLDIRSYPVKFPEQIINAKPEILISNTRLRVDSETFRKFPSVRVFATVSSGVDHVNFSDLKKEGRVFLNSPGCNAGSVAEYCWVSLRNFFSEQELKTKTVGLFGYGNTGKAFGEILKQKGISFVYNDPFIKDKSVSRQEVFASSILSFHVPLVSDGPYPTLHMLEEKDLALIRPGTLIMNTSRGEIWTTETFLNILKRKDLFKVIDVFSPEPPVGEIANLMTDVQDSIFTPHIAGYSQLGRLLGTYRLAKKLCVLYQDGPLPPVEKFLQTETQIQTESFLKEENSNLRLAWKNGDWEYFERRRNSYPIRLDMGLTKNEE